MPDVRGKSDDWRTFLKDPRVVVDVGPAACRGEWDAAAARHAALDAAAQDAAALAHARNVHHPGAPVGIDAVPKLRGEWAC